MFSCFENSKRGWCWVLPPIIFPQICLRFSPRAHKIGAFLWRNSCWSDPTFLKKKSDQNLSPKQRNGLGWRRWMWCYHSMFGLFFVLNLTLSFTQDTNHHYPTLAHLNASSSVIIHRRDLPMVSFNSELNSTHFSFKISGLHEKSTGRPLGERASLTLFPPKG